MPRTGGNDSYTKLLLHLNGADGATSTDDSSGSNHSITFAGTAQLDTAQKKFETASLLLDGDSDYISAANHADFNYGTGKFTIDFWCRPSTDLNSINTVFFDFYDSGGNDWYSLCDYNSGYLEFRITDSGSTTVSLQTSSAYAWAADTWYHIAVIRGWGGNANDWAITIDGSSVATLTDADGVPSIDGAFRIGFGRHTDGTNDYFPGHFDEVRVSKGVARWTANFTPPTKEYYTLLPSGIHVGSEPAMYKWKKKGFIYIPSKLHYKYKEII